MTELRDWLAALSPAARTALLVLVLIQVALQATALVHLVRRSVPPGGGRGVWAAVILVGNLLGPVLYFALARGAGPAAAAPGADADAARRAADVLYGPEQRP